MHTAVCVDPAKFLPKPKSANLKVVQMNPIMWLARLGFPWLGSVFNSAAWSTVVWLCGCYV